MDEKKISRSNFYLTFHKSTRHPENFECLTVNLLYSLELAHLHHNFPIIYFHLHQSKLISLPHDVKITLSKEIVSHRKKTLGMAFELLRIVAILKQNNIKIVPYKGPLLALIAYGETTLRSFDDLDILVTDEDYFKVRTILQ